jgi:hypothetical protein
MLPYFKIIFLLFSYLNSRECTGVSKEDTVCIESEHSFCVSFYKALKNKLFFSGTLLLSIPASTKNKKLKLKVMKRQSTSLFTQLGKEELTALTTTVNEVVAFDCKNSNNKIFSAADLWNIQRQRRSFVQRRNRF